jgi:hypothetical protein
MRHPVARYIARDPLGRATRVVGCMSDVTQAKRLQALSTLVSSLCGARDQQFLEVLEWTALLA